MIEELKALLDVVKGLPDLAVWSLFGFGIYKTIIYLSTTGAVVYCVRLALDTITKLYIRYMDEVKEERLAVIELKKQR